MHLNNAVTPRDFTTNTPSDTLNAFDGAVLYSRSSTSPNGSIYAPVCGSPWYRSPSTEYFHLCNFQNTLKLI
ncbi:Hypothetical predicted protein [Octopus vulgaris]|uniref:Uncharacterized protein n=1 Tax=Octopus vulgaris TaxID=6645 RepID=A0AA36BE62_OCTVU|nr:Hypothetical predicted protein [Octopus vulgaris]